METPTNRINFDAIDLDDIKVSVIIPVYNTLRYLRDCLDSVLAQTHRNTEVIIVNDGSTDGSLEVIREYEQRDARIVVIDKPNGGYGHSVNQGLAAASGEYLSIVEPDDIIESHMYRDLLIAAAAYAPKNEVDIIKSSYWNYYAPEHEQPWVEPPHLMDAMPPTVQSIDVYADCEVMNHHPSIWSALYRRGFLEDINCRMIEPKGAGWADNPFFFETMLQARSILWVPTAYYHYRQDNPGASSRLKDFHLPFDRLRDVREIYRRLNITNEQLIACLYTREFNYIRTCLEEFEFPESDPELRKLIEETLRTMDRRILFNPANHIHRDFLAYYKDFTGEELETLPSRDALDHPRFSLICILENVRPYLWQHLKSLLSQTYASLEVICVECRSRDRGAQIARECAEKDHRVRVLGEQLDSFGEALVLAIDQSCGDLIIPVDPRATYPRDFLKELIGHLSSNESASFYCQSTAKHKDIRMTSAANWIENAWEVICSPDISIFDAIITADFGKSLSIEASPDAIGKATLARLAKQARTIQFVPRSERRPISYRPATNPQASQEEMSSCARLRIGELSSLAAVLGDSLAAKRALANNAVLSMLEDIEALESALEIQQYFGIMDQAVRTYGLLDLSPLDYDSAVAYNEFYELYSQRGSAYFLQQGEKAKRELRKLHNSRSYLLSLRLSDAARKISALLKRKI